MSRNIRSARIKTEEDYDRALAAVDQLMAAEPGTPEGDALDVLVTLITGQVTWAGDTADHTVCRQEQESRIGR